MTLRVVWVLVYGAVVTGGKINDLKGKAVLVRVNGNFTMFIILLRLYWKFYPFVYKGSKTTSSRQRVALRERR